jgi:hypothetical protein
MNYNLETHEDESRDLTVWEKELYLRYETQGNLAFELGVNQLAAETDGVVFGICPVGLPDPYSYTVDRKIRDQFYGLNLRMQYALRCAHMPRLTNYPGVLLSPTLRVSDDDQLVRTITQGSGSENWVTTTTRDVWMQFGIEDMIRYQVGRHLAVHSILSYKFIVGNNQLQRGFAAQAGLAYCF